ncbi:MAG: GNAT family N-acetyltransferase [Chloroflexota bacterium]|nr:GNAT family N-acetyltransferase [Chloroflexota bacterium]
MVTLQGELVLLRPVVPADATRLAEILADPGVAEWWPGYDLERVQREMIEPEEETVILGIELEADGPLIGLIQYWEENDPDYRHAGIDIFLHPTWHGRGLGANALRTITRHLFDDRGHHRITIDPAAHNERAIRSYQGVGFRPVGIMRRYERGLDGTWHDSLLMDLLVDERT